MEPETRENLARDPEDDIEALLLSTEKRLLNHDDRGAAICS